LKRRNSSPLTLSECNTRFTPTRDRFFYQAQKEYLLNRVAAGGGAVSQTLWAAIGKRQWADAPIKPRCRRRLQQSGSDSKATKVGADRVCLPDLRTAVAQRFARFCQHAPRCDFAHGRCDALIQDRPVVIGVERLLVRIERAFAQCNGDTAGQIRELETPGINRAAEPSADRFGTRASRAHSPPRARRPGGRRQPARGFPDRWAGSRTETT
jgi:hypothetical protein